MGFLDESAPHGRVPIGASTRSPPEFSGSQWPNLKREFLSLSAIANSIVLRFFVGGRTKIRNRRKPSWERDD